jgi:hypothetical protein
MDGRGFAGTLIGFTTTLLLGLLLISALLGWSIALGAALAAIFDFSLFEGAVLALIATGIVLGSVIGIIRYSVSENRPSSLDNPYEEALIPVERFTSRPQRATWDHIFRFNLANDILEALADRDMPANLNRAQREQLAIHLSEIVAAEIKARQPPRRGPLQINADELKARMAAMDLTPYDDEILETTVLIANQLTALPHFRRVISNDLWNTRVTSYFDE